MLKAKQGRLKDLHTGQYVVLENAERTQGTPGTGNFIMETFKEYAIRIDKKTKPVDYALEAIASEELWHSADIINQVELQKRFAIV